MGSNGDVVTFACERRDLWNLFQMLELELQKVSL